MFKFLAGVVAWTAANLGLFAGLPPAVTAAVATAGVVLSIWGIHSAPGDTSPLANWLNTLPGEGFKTIVGTCIAGIAYLLSPSVIAVLPPTVAHGLQIVGILLAGFGLYHAQARSS